MLAEADDAAEIERAGDHAAPVVLTCEHASECLPAPWTWPEADRRLVGTHWAFDLGASELTRELARELRTTAVLSRFSRLLIDPNRPDDAPDLFRGTAEGEPVELNRNIDEQDRARRLELYRAYHAVADREVARSSAEVVLSVHTFTPVYEGAARAVEVGVLFDEEATLAEGLRGALQRSGFRALPNEPYSGKEGLIYSADRHARRHGRRALEIELRQDLALDGGARRRLVLAVRDFFLPRSLP